ncbi:MAG: TetR/AcrR family transcriptional regulator [Candidatus Heimdallarchaeota archaeon]|nr:TetR/AcrR family transcriptional regulator [Candidatus Heimdallarchaeota archaeon]
MTQTRARSKEAKEQQVQKIIEEARNLFIEVGTRGFSMRALAKRLDMSQGNLYNYWSSKRQLWYEIVKRDFADFEDEITKIVTSHEGTVLDLLENLADFYFDFAESNYRRYQIMFVIPPPPTDSSESEADKFEPQSINMLLMLVENAITEMNIENVDTKKFALYLWTVIHGTVLITNTILFDQRYDAAVFGSKKDFREYVKNQIKNQLDTVFS